MSGIKRLVHCEWCDKKEKLSTALRGKTGWCRGGHSRKYRLQDMAFYCTIKHADLEMEARLRQE